MTTARLEEIERENEAVIKSDGGTCPVTDWTRELTAEVRTIRQRIIACEASRERLKIACKALERLVPIKEADTVIAMLAALGKDKV